MAEKVEFVCESCGQKYRLKGSPEELHEELLFCPQCGGKLRSVSGGRAKSLVVLREGMLEDLLISGPVALFYWDLSISKGSVEEIFRKEGYAIREFEDQVSLKYWLRLFVPEVVVFATENEPLLSSFENLLEELPMEDYRRIFRIRISSKYQTLEPMQVFLSGAHLICNPRDLERFKEIYRKARDYWKVLYAPYFEAYKTLKERGAQ